MSMRVLSPEHFSNSLIFSDTTTLTFAAGILIALSSQNKLSARKVKRILSPEIEMALLTISS